MAEDADFSRVGAAAPRADVGGSDAPRRLPPGTLLRGTYHIVRRLSQGGMGEVYEATHTRLPGRYAVKVLRGDLSQDVEATLRFRREAEITSRLRHPGIVSLVDFDATDQGEPYIVMEFLEGEDLAKALARPEPRARAWIADVVSQIAAALGAAHAQGVVHRDLKPQNVFLVPLASGRHRVKVVDFGISKMHELSQRLTRESALLGTPPYMSPEQAVGRSDDVDARADQFALATLTYELVTGHRPFDGENVMALFYQIVNVDPPPMGTWVPAVPAALEAVVRKGLAKSREARFASIEAFAAAFAEVVAREAEAPPEGARRPGPVAKSRRSLRVAFGVMAGLGLVAAGWRLWPLSGGALLRGRAREPAPGLSPTPAGLPPPSSAAPVPVQERPSPEARSEGPPQGAVPDGERAKVRAGEVVTPLSPSQASSLPKRTTRESSRVRRPSAPRSRPEAVAPAAAQPVMPATPEPPARRTQTLMRDI